MLQSVCKILCAAHFVRRVTCLLQCDDLRQQWGRGGEQGPGRHATHNRGNRGGGGGRRSSRRGHSGWWIVERKAPQQQQRVHSAPASQPAVGQPRAEQSRAEREGHGREWQHEAGGSVARWCVCVSAKSTSICSAGGSDATSSALLCSALCSQTARSSTQLT
jgi:hypothetical protein